MDAERLLSFVVRDADQRESMIGDLREERERLARRVGHEQAARWHFRQSVSIAARYGTMRLLRRKPPVRWITLAQESEGGHWTGVTRDLRYAWRAIAQRPSLSAVVVLTLAMALAANSTTFSLMDALVLRPYRFPGVDRLMVVAANNADQSLFDKESVSAADFREWQQQSKTVKQWASYDWWDANLSGVDIPEQVSAFHVTPGFFALLGIQPLIGREFLNDEARPGQGHRVVLGHKLWTRRFGADPKLIGKTIRLDAEAYEVVGIAPPGFDIPNGAEVWAPAAYTDQQWQDRRAGNLTIFASLADGRTIDEARAELVAIGDTQRRDHPDSNTNRVVRVVSFKDGMADPAAGAFMVIWQIAAALLLLIACANIANLLMARGAERAQEYALRLALGASRGRLFAQTLLEGLVLSGLALALSMPLIAAGLSLSRAAIPPSVIRFVPGWMFIHIDVRLFVTTAILGTGAMLVFSLVPALQAMRSQVADSLRQAGRTLTPGRSRNWLRSTLAATQVALALALLFASTLALTAADRTINGVLGYDKNNVLVGEVVLPTRTYEDADKRRRFITSVMDTMRTIPAVASVGMTSSIPAGFSNGSRQLWPEGVELTEADARYVNFRRSTNGYFEALRIPKLRGRWFEESDRVDTTPVAVVSAGLVERYWPNQDPLGKRFRLALKGPWITVVGVTGDVVHNWFTQRRDNTVYRPLSQDVPFGFAFALRTISDPEALAGDLRRAVTAADPDQPIASLSSLDGLVNERAAGFTFIARALGIVSLIALVLSIMGIYSLMAYLTTQRTQEIGVRMALGAGRWQVVRLTTARALNITATGIGIGAALAFGLGRIMQSTLFGLVNTDLALLTALVFALGAAALLAAYFPARRASRIDPMAALRES